MFYWYFFGSFFAKKEHRALLVSAAGLAGGEQLDGAGGAQAVRAEVEELLDILHGGDAARSLDLAAARNVLGEQLNVVEGRAAGGKTGGRLDEVSTGLGDDVAHLDLLFLGQQAGLDDDLQHLVAHGGLDGGNVIAHIVVLLVFQPADVDDHIDLGRAVLNGSFGLKGLTGGVHSAEGEADDAADRHTARHVLGGLLDIAGIDADRSAVVGDGLVTQGLDLGPGSLGLEQGMVDLAQHFFFRVFHRKFSPFSQRLHRRA